MKRNNSSLRVHLLAFVLTAVVGSAMAVRADVTGFEITPVAKGVYAIIAKPGYASNGAFIVNQDDVVVVDTQLRPSWARDLIGEIKKVTNKPVRYVINTHWHRDHVQGNQAFVAAYPGVTIIQQQLTRDDQLKMQPIEIKTRAPEEIARLEKLLSSGKNEKGAPLTADERKELQRLLDLQHAYVAEIPSIQLVTANLVFDHTLILHDGVREIDLFYYGYAHSRGDLVVYLPGEKVVMTGDLLESQVPKMPSAYPSKWASALRAVQKLDWNVNIPGHGAVQHNKDMLIQFADYLNDLTASVKASIAKGMSEEQTVKSVDMSKYSKMAEFDERNPDAIRRAYVELTGKITD